MQKLKKTKSKHETTSRGEEYEGSYYFDCGEFSYQTEPVSDKALAKSSSAKKKKIVQIETYDTNPTTSGFIANYQPQFMPYTSASLLPALPAQQQTQAPEAISGDFYTENPPNERTRLVSINEAFEILRVNIPTFPYERRLSKIDTLHLAISYINLLECVLKSNMNLEQYLRAYIDYKSSQFNQLTMVKPLWDSSGRRFYYNIC
jgi:hypothetical protein